MNQFFAGLFSHKTSQAAIADLTPPVFSGVALLTPKDNGAIKVDWLAATDATHPIEYLVYIALGTVNAAALFQASNLVVIVPEGILSKYVFTLGDQTTYIIKGQVYTIGVRAKDGVGNIDSNTVILTTTAIGSVDLATIFQTLQTQFSADETLLQEIITSANSNLQLAAGGLIGILNDTNGILGTVDASLEIVGDLDC